LTVIERDSGAVDKCQMYVASDRKKQCEYDDRQTQCKHGS